MRLYILADPGQALLDLAITVRVVWRLLQEIRMCGMAAD